MIITADLIASFISVLSFSKRMRPFLRLGGPVKDPNIDHSFMTFLTVDALLPRNLAVSLIAYNEKKNILCYEKHHDLIWLQNEQ